MAINKATLAKKINNVIEYVYPKTSADIVIYDSNYSVGSIIDKLISTKIDKEDGKGLSSNDFTNEYKNRLDSYDSFVIDDALNSTSKHSVENRAIYTKIMEVRSELKEDIANITNSEEMGQILDNIATLEEWMNDDSSLSAAMVTDINNLKTTVGDSSNGLVKDITSLKTTVGNSSSGIVKDVTSLKNTVGSSSSGIVKDVASLKTTMGDSSSGVVKDIASLKTTVGDNNSGLVKKANDLESGLGLSSNSANRYGTTAWSRINYLQNNINNYQLNGQIFFSYDLYQLLYRINSGLNSLNGKIHILAKEYPDTHDTPEYDVGDTIDFNGITNPYGDEAIYFHSDYYSDSDRKVFAIDSEESGYYVILIKLNGFNY